MNQTNISTPFSGEINPHRSVSFTRRESEILQLVSEGLTDKEIGNRLSLSEGTVGWHFANLHKKHRFKSRCQALTAWLCYTYFRESSTTSTALCPAKIQLEK